MSLISTVFLLPCDAQSNALDWLGMEVVSGTVSFFSCLKDKLDLGSELAIGALPEELLSFEDEVVGPELVGLDVAPNPKPPKEVLGN